MSIDVMAAVRVAARDEHKRLGFKPRTLAVTPKGKIYRASRCATMRHVVMGTYDKNARLSAMIEDAECAYSELLESRDEQA
jgi:hypothetical protein